MFILNMFRVKCELSFILVFLMDLEFDRQPSENGNCLNVVEHLVTLFSLPPSLLRGT